MYIKPQYAKIALKNADAKRKAQGIVFDPKDIAAYRAKLKEVAKNNEIKEGTELDFIIYYAIKQDINSLIDRLVSGVEHKSEEFRKNVKASDYVLAAHDYLLALATIELGSPDIPTDQLGTNFARWTETVVEANPNYGISATDTYEKQRRIDAKQLLASKIQPLMDGLNNRQTKAESLGKLIAEYQALYRRQANHNAIWRLFHLTENAERTTLLKEMEQVIKAELVNILDLDIKTADPTEVARALEETLQNKRLSLGSKLYNMDVGSVYGFNEYIFNPSRLDDVNAELEIEKILKENEKDYNI